MNYDQVREMLPGKRRWRKWLNYIYLQRWRGTIRIRFGYRYNHTRVAATWYPDGRFKFTGQCYYPSMRWKLNHFLPDGYVIVTHRYYSFLWDEKRQDRDDARAFYLRNDDGDQAKFNKEHQWILITKNGIQGKLGPTLKEIREQLLHADDLRDMPRRRGRYWLRKARGVFRRNICGRSYGEGCAWHKAWPKPTTAWKGECGCEVYTKKANSIDTVASIMAEENATVRTAKIQIYGVEKFFSDAGAKTIGKEAGYELITLDTGRAHRENDRWGREQTANVVLTALRMQCSTTGKTYVNTVPPNMRTVREALNWMYEIPNYLGRVGKQT